MPSANMQEARQNFLNALDGLMSSGKVSTAPLPTINPYQTPARPQIDPLTFSLSDYQTEKPAPDDESWLTKALTGMSSIGALVQDPIAQWSLTKPFDYHRYSDAMGKGIQEAKAANGGNPLGGLDFLGAGVKGLFQHGFDGLSWHDLPEADNVANAYKGIKDSWTDGSYGAGDFPLFGAMYGMGKYGRNGEDILKNNGVTNPNVLKYGGLGLSIGLDPSMYLSGGSAAALKVGKLAQVAKAGEIASDAGLNLSSKFLKGKTAAEDIGDLIKNQHIDNAYGKVAGPWTKEMDDMFQGLASQKGASAAEEIVNARKAAQLPYENKLLAWNVPGTPLVGKGFGSVPSWLKRSPVALGIGGTSAADHLIEQLGLKGNEAENLLKDRYGVTSTEKLSADNLKDLRLHTEDELAKRGATFDRPSYTNIEQVLNYSKPDVSNLVGKGVEGRNVLNVLNKFGLGDNWIPNIIGGGRNLGTDTAKLAEEAPGILHNEADKMYDASNWANKASMQGTQDTMRGLADTLSSSENTAKLGYSPLDTVFEKVGARGAEKGADLAQGWSPYVRDLFAGQSKAGAFANRVNPFNARTFRSADEFVNQAANYKADTQTKIVGQSKIAEKALQGIHGEMKDFSLKERQAVIHYIEGVFPKSIDPAHLDMKKIAAVGDKLKTFLGEIGQRDLKSGTINGLLENYFPHVMRPNTDLNNLAKANPEINGLLGKSKKNKFGQERKGFDSMAQWQDAIDSLEGAGKTDLANELKQLFVNDPTEAAGFRAYKSIRSSAYSDLYAKLEKDGLLHKMDKPELHQSGKGDSFRKLTDAEAKALDLPTDTVMHKDVIKGMQDLHDMFTTEGMNHAWKVIGAVNGLWKSVVTALPSHHINNLVGNVAVNTMAGVKPTHYFEAMKMLKAGDSPLIKEAIERGVISQGFISEFAQDAMVKSPFAKPSEGKFVDGLNKASEKIRNSEIKVGKVRIGAKPMTELGEKTDDFSRFALFLHGMERTGSVEKAAGMVRKYLFNYSEITHADRVMKQVFPFWNWIKNNVPLQLKAFAQHQGFFQAKNKIQNTMNEDVKDGNPAYKTEDYLHIPGTDKGMPLRLPQNDLQMIGNPAHMAQQLGASLSPIWKTPIEMGMNKQFFNNAPVWKTNKGATDNSQAMDIVKYLANQLGGVGKVSQLIQNSMDDKPGSTPILDFLRGITIGNTTTYK